MKGVTDVIAQTQGQTPARAPLTQPQTDTVGYFFARVRVIYGNQYNSAFPDESSEKFAKREYARQVCDISRNRMDEGFHALHQQRQINPDKWRFLDIDQIIGLVKTGGQHWEHRVRAAKEAEQIKALPVLRSEDTKNRVSDAIQQLRKDLK